MVLPEGLLIGLNIIIQVSMNGMAPPQNPQTPQAAAQSTAFFMRAALAVIGVTIPYYVVYALALGATAYALSEVYLGRTTTIREAYRVVGRKFWRLLWSHLLDPSSCCRHFHTGRLPLRPRGGKHGLMPKSMAWVSIIMVLITFLGFIIGGILVVSLPVALQRSGPRAGA